MLTLQVECCAFEVSVVTVVDRLDYHQEFVCNSRPIHVCVDLSRGSSAPCRQQFVCNSRPIHVSVDRSRGYSSAPSADKLRIF